MLHHLDLIGEVAVFPGGIVFFWGVQHGEVVAGSY